MRGYPKYVATKKDYENLMAMKEYKDQAIKELSAIRDLDDDKAIEVVSSTTDEETGKETVVTKEIDNAMPAYKIKGFKSRQEVADLISAADVKKEV